MKHAVRGGLFAHRFHERGGRAADGDLLCDVREPICFDRRQAGLPSPGASLTQRVSYLGGPHGLYRGAAPGVLCGAFRNGCAGAVMNSLVNPLLTRLGLRD